VGIELKTTMGCLVKFGHRLDGEDYRRTEVIEGRFKTYNFLEGVFFEYTTIHYRKDNERNALV